MKVDNDRRDFFRIQDEVSFKLAPYIDESSLTKPLFEGVSDELETLNALRKYDIEHRSLLASISDKYSIISQYFKIQNQKFETLAKYIINKFGTEFQKQSVNISGSGLSYLSDEPLSQKSNWHIAILLFPEYFYFQSKCTVVSCELEATETQQDQYRVSLEFVDFDLKIQDELIKHVTQRQSEQLRRERLNKND